MSNSATHWAWHLARRLNAADEDGLDPGALLVLLAMCDVADEHEITYPSRLTVASWTGQSEKTVRRHVLALEARGLIVRLTERRRRETGLFAQDAWTLNIAGDAEPPDPEALKRTIADKVAARKARSAGAPAVKMTGGPAVKMTGGPAVNLSRTSGHFVPPSMDEPLKVKPVRKETGAPAPAPGGASAPVWNTLAGRLATFVEEQRRVDADRCRSWFEPLRAQGEETLVAPSGFFARYVTNHFGDHLRLGRIDLDVVEIVAAGDSVEDAKSSTG